MLVARFRRHYPDALWRAPEYRTTGHVIPFGLFWIYYAAMGREQAFERAQLARGVTHAISLAFAKKDDGIPSGLQDDLRAAYLAPPES